MNNKLKYNNLYNTAIYCHNEKSNKITDVNYELKSRLESIESNLENNDNTMLNTK